jgi:ABC-type sugar transport system permease subunit
MFVLPFYIGFALFIFYPMLQSLSFVFSKVTIEVGGFETTGVGLSNIRYLLLEDPDFNKNLVASLLQILYQVPVVIIAALFFAIILNQKFFGRTVVRAVFFLPVIITSGVVMAIMKADAFANSLISGAGGMQSISSSTSFGLQEILINVGLSMEIVEYFTFISSNLFDLLWRTGIQMIIFLAGLQTIPPSLYEASSIEGASAWENFWMITIPMISPMILVNLVYTVVDVFTDSTNSVMMMVSTSLKSQAFANAAAMAWIYFAIVGVALAIVVAIYSRMMRKMNI